VAARGAGARRACRQAARRRPRRLGSLAAGDSRCQPVELACRVRARARRLHGAAIRSPSGRLVRLPRWRAWVEHVGVALDRFRAAA
jgi:hypothetical protein